MRDTQTIFSPLSTLESPLDKSSATAISSSASDEPNPKRLRISPSTVPTPPPTSTTAAASSTATTSTSSDIMDRFSAVTEALTVGSRTFANPRSPTLTPAASDKKRKFTSTVPQATPVNDKSQKEKENTPSTAVSTTTTGATATHQPTKLNK